MSFFSNAPTGASFFFPKASAAVETSSTASTEIVEQIEQPMMDDETNDLEENYGKYCLRIYLKYKFIMFI
jgi:hypothetical protein